MNCAHRAEHTRPASPAKKTVSRCSGPTNAFTMNMPPNAPSAAQPPWLMMRNLPKCHSCQELARRSAAARKASQMKARRTTTK